MDPVYSGIFIGQPTINQWERIYRTKGGCANIIIHYWKQKISFFFFLSKTESSLFWFSLFPSIIHYCYHHHQPTNRPTIILFSIFLPTKTIIYFLLITEKKIYLVGVLIHTAGFSFGDFSVFFLVLFQLFFLVNFDFLLAIHVCIFLTEKQKTEN